ncbi:hypothetical protein ACP0FZ_30555, partial [Escherichia coli]|uniref:hypothetical protein n=1 Tax=Escherichia coli TaxID=562 RepID=UPI003CFA0A49
LISINELSIFFDILFTISKRFELIFCLEENRVFVSFNISDKSLNSVSILFFTSSIFEMSKSFSRLFSFKN